MKLKLICLCVTVALLCGCLTVAINGKEETTMVYSQIESEQLYSFMNCDTGRVIRSGSVEYFKLVAADDSGEVFYLTDADSGETYSIDNKTLKTGAIKQKLKIRHVGQNRFTVQLLNGTFIKDDDSGDTNDAALANDANGKTIENYWYLTKQGQHPPVKMMPIGDSLTNGEDADIPAEQRCGYRALLSSKIAESNENLRIVFVGSQKSGGVAYGNSMSLYRHEGHNGYVINDIYNISPHYGIYQYMTPWLTKYQPDVFFVMLGTNDIGLTWQKGELSDLDPIAANWELLIKTFLEVIPEGGMVVAGAVPPIRNSEVYNSWAKKFNSMIFPKVSTLSSDEKEVVFADIHRAILDNGLSTSFCSDGGHFNSSGYTAVANRFFDAFIHSDTYTALCENIEKDRLADEGTAVGTDTAVTSEAVTNDVNDTSTGSSILRILIPVAVGIAVAAVAGIVLFKKKKGR